MVWDTSWYESIVIPTCCPRLVSAGPRPRYSLKPLLVLRWYNSSCFSYRCNIYTSVECPEARAWAVVFCRGPGGFYGTISPALCREGSQTQHLPQLRVPESVCDDVGISSLSLRWSLLGMCQYSCITSTTNACNSFTKIKSGLYNSLLSSLICASWNTVQSCFFASFDNVSHI